MLGPFNWLKVERGAAVVVLVHNLDSDEFLFVKQFRYPCATSGDPWLQELVAGMVDAGETVEQAALRESVEEGGFRPTRLIPGPQFYSSPGGSSEFMHGFYAPITQADQVSDGGGSDHGEDLELVWVPRHMALEQALDGSIRDAKSLVMLLWFQANGG
jgi:nudix-type nucleoside diphosphatase (YffH/AdpP family)